MLRYGIISAGIVLFSIGSRAGDRSLKDPYLERARASLTHFSGRIQATRPRITRHLTQRIATFETTLDGLPVFHENTTVQMDEAFTIRRRAGTALAVADEPSHPTPAIERIIAWTEAHGEVVDEAVPGWLRLGEDRLTAVVRVDTRERPPAEPLRLYLDASSGRILRTERLRWTQAMSTPVGSIFIENPLTTSEVATVPLTFLEEETTVLNGRYAQVSTCIDREKCKEHSPLAIRAAEGAEFVFDPVFDPENFDDPFAEVNTYHHITTFSQWMRETFGWDALFHGREWIEVRVGRQWNNAAYYLGTEERPDLIVFGKDEEANFAYDADVIYHELSHAVIQTLWEHPWMSRDALGIDVAMNGLEEGLADMWAETFAGDPTMDMYITRSRTAANDHTCPNDLYSEGHLEAQILSGFAWDVRQQIGKAAHEQILYRSMFFLEENINFRDFVLALEQSATDLAEEQASAVRRWHVEAIRQQAVNRGLLDEDCRDRLVPFIDKQTRIVVGYGNRLTNNYDYPFGLQWKITTPANAESFKLYLSWTFPEESEDGEPVTPGYRVHIRRGEPVEIRWLEAADLIEGEPAFEALCDYTFDGAPTEVGFPLQNMAAAAPGEIFYVLLSADTEEPIIAVEGELRFSIVQSTPPGDTPTAETVPRETPLAATGRSGCQVSAVGTGEDAPVTSLIQLIF